MKFLNVEFIGYIGFKNGMGLDRVYIDFTKGRNNIILISGMNGSGKSTLLSHLNIFPDPSSSFTPYVDASKKFTISDNDIIYNIQLFSASDSNGGRKTTKAFIQKNGVELNSNGNISSYKDIIDSEFELDSNYLMLSHLSNDGNKGLGSLTPSERKKFTSNIMENLEVYNDMYKTLSKKSSVYKTYITNLHAKIQNIGSKDYIETTLKQLREKEHNISVKIMDLNNTIVSIQAKCVVDEEESKKIEDLGVQLTSLKRDLEDLSTQVKTYYNKTKIKPDKIVDTYNEDISLLNTYNTNYETSKTEWINLSKSLQDTTKNIQTIEAEYNIYQEDDTIERQYNESKEKIANITNEISSYGYEADTRLILPLTNLLRIFTDFMALVDSLYDDINSEDLKAVTIEYNPNAIEEYQTELQNLFQEINNIDSQLRDVREKLKQVNILNDRPKKCSIDNCPFIKEAVTIESQYGNKKLADELVRLQRELNKASERVTKVNEFIEISRYRDSKHSIITRITELLNSNSSLFELLGTSILTNVENVLKMLSRQYSFNEIKDPIVYKNLLNALISYESEIKIFDKLSIQFESYKDKMKLIESNNKMLKNLKDQENELIEKVRVSKSNLDNYKSLYNRILEKTNEEYNYKVAYESKCKLKDEVDRIQSIISEYTSKAGKSMQLLSQIKGYREQIDQLTNSSKPISDEISKLTGQLTMIESYETEYKAYKEQYDMIEALKKYCSPTSGGIQVLFMQIYMSKTLELSNQILSMLFNNEYRLLDFVINQNEFRIPFIGNGLPVDDISSGSSSQVCMMSMIINLVLLHQASTKFNIARLDEIDDSLDTYNRSNFVNVLYRILPLLNIEQLFIISHSIELDSSFADIIKLKSYEEYDSINSNNIIWDYKENI